MIVFDTLIRILKKTVLLFFMVLLSNAVFARDSEERVVKSFDDIRVTGRMEVRLEEGKKERLRIEAEGIEISKVFTEHSGGTLKIYIQRGFLKEDIDVKVYVTYTKLREIHSSALASIKGKSIIKGDKLVVDVNRNGKAELKIDVSTIDLTVSSSGELDISGRTETQNTRVNTGGKLKAFDLDCDNTYIRVNTTGTGEVRANKLLEATVNTAGNLRIKGSPAEETIKSGAGGTVTRLVD